MRQSLVIAVLLLASQTLAFQVAPLGGKRALLLTSLSAKKKKRSVLGEVATSGGAPTQAPSTSKRSTSKKTSGGTVSPALAEWASTTSTPTTSNDNDKPATSTTSEPETATADTFVRFQNDKSSDKKSSRRVKQSARKEEEEQRDATVASIVDNINLVLENTKNSLDDILTAIRPILSQQTGNLRLLTASGNQQYNYRLAWVGSDEALCHVGTGLHNVPLARMQEVFLTCQGKGRIQVLEVISILGPFPNVRNTLQGDSKVSRVGDDVQEWEITYDSMIDGTGKEILAGTDDNIRRVKLQVYFADPNAILAVVPPESGAARDDPLQDDGVNALLFLREDDLDAKLDMMRVS